MAIYLDRLSDARAELSKLTEVTGALASRRDLLSAELELWDGWHEPAQNQALALLENDQVDARITARARALTVRCAVRREDYTTALKLLPGALDAAAQFSLEHVRGILLHCASYSHLRLSHDPKTTGLAFGTELAHLAAIGDARWEAICRSLHGLFLFEIGSIEAAESEYLMARKIAFELGIPREALWAENNLAQLFIATNRDEQAVALLEYLIEADRAERFGIAEANALTSLAFAFGLCGRHHDAIEAANEAIALAELHDLTGLRINAGILASWSGALRGVKESVAALRRFIERGDLNSQQRMKATLCLADALVARRPDEAAELWAKGVDLAEGELGDAYVRLVEHVRSRMRAAPVRLGASGELIIDPAKGFLQWDVLLGTVQRWLLKEAFKRGEGCQTTAARLLGITRSRFSDKWKTLLLGRPARERYGLPDDPDVR